MSLLCNFYYWWWNWQISWIKRPHKKLNLRGIWICAFAYEQIQLARGICENSDNDTIRFIRISVISKGHTVTYRLLCVNNCPQNLNPNIYRLTVGGNHINYPLDVSTPTSDLITSNIVFNSFVCSPGARYHPTIQIDRLGRIFFCLLWIFEECMAYLRLEKLPMNSLPIVSTKLDTNNANKLLVSIVMSGEP